MNRGGAPSWWPRWRRAFDCCTTGVITAGGGLVLIIVVVLFVFLLLEIAPLLQPATLSAEGDLKPQTPSDERLLRLSVGEQGNVIFTLDAAGVARFLDAADGAEIQRIELADHAPLTAIATAGTGMSDTLLGYADGTIRLVREAPRYEFREGYRTTLRTLEYPWGGAPQPALRSEPVAGLALSADGHSAALQYAGGEVFVLLSGNGAARAPSSDSAPPVVHSLGVWPLASAIYAGVDDRWLMLIFEDGGYRLWPLDATETSLAGSGRLFSDELTLSASVMLQGSRSLVAAASDGSLAQYVVAGSGGSARLMAIRGFDTEGETITRLLAEHGRRGFLAFNETSMQWFNATAGSRALRAATGMTGAELAALSPRSNMLLIAEASGTLRRWRLSNPHPEISLSSLWRRVWYEGYSEPTWVYQSSSSSDDYESKYSLTPLAFGTLKTAFYTMLLAVPLAVGAAAYTAFFMSPGLRRRIKPTIELMEALPTVILGFLAGLWLAPLVEDNLSGFIALVVAVPLGVLLFALLFQQLPLAWRKLLPDGWQAILLIPVVASLVWLGLVLGEPMEHWLFAGDTQRWLSEELGLAYDQRNAMVVGIAMGFAVIPTVFSIAEDAMVSVPGHLSDGSLALGATPWQTLTGVVLPTASPGVFSAVLIGFGRAVGETMIVLMATGNTPVMDFNLFEGMRSVAANIAMEVPEAEVDSTHYRLLFLTAFMLFAFTFVVNTVAEVVRQRLRARYGALG